MWWPRLLYHLVAMTCTWSNPRTQRIDDLFVRWKRLSPQARGCHRDLTDDVPMGIRPFAAAETFRKKQIMWDKDCGKQPWQARAEYPWFWAGSTFTGNRVNDVHLTREQKQKARTR